MESGESQIEFVNFDIVALIKEIVKSKSILFEQKILALYLIIQKQYMYGEMYMLRKKLLITTSNAINHADNERVIEINLEQRDNALRVNVFNSGKNILKMNLTKCDKFYKVDKARTREYGGSE